MLIQRNPFAPAPAAPDKPGAKQATHEDPGDVINGIRVPRPGQEKRTKKKGGKTVILCSICGMENCCYTTVVEG